MKKGLDPQLDRSKTAQKSSPLSLYFLACLFGYPGSAA